MAARPSQSWGTGERIDVPLARLVGLQVRAKYFRLPAGFDSCLACLQLHSAEPCFAPLQSTIPACRRYKCCVCEDIDLCGACMRALVAARVKMSQEAAPRPAPPRQVGRLCRALSGRQTILRVDVWKRAQVEKLHSTHCNVFLTPLPKLPSPPLSGRPPAALGGQASQP